MGVAWKGGRVGDAFPFLAFFDEDWGPVLTDEASSWTTLSAWVEMRTTGIKDSSNSSKSGMCDMKLHKACEE
jgi:hypothetical protein